ncbi:hypothetical protein [Paraburkholderia ginsengiterrae]|nr:hypothetical protein [Paraburkholderia ginsengiterrae]
MAVSHAYLAGFAVPLWQQSSFKGPWVYPPKANCHNNAPLHKAMNAADARASASGPPPGGIHARLCIAGRRVAGARYNLSRTA